jgi:hypothetical protein
MFSMASREKDKVRIDLFTRTQRYPEGVGLLFDINGRRIISLELAVSAESLDEQDECPDQICPQERARHILVRPDLFAGTLRDRSRWIPPVSLLC